jgi:hypothetical protein
MGHRIRWIKRGEPVTVGGVRWLLLEYAQEQADRRDRYVRVYRTAFQDRGLRVEYDAPYALRAEVARSAETLQVHDCALASAEVPGPAGGQPVSSDARTCDQAEIRAQLAADPRRVAIGGGRVTLVPPPGMQMHQRSKAETVFVDSAGVVVIVSFRQDLPILDSPAYREAMERRLETGFQQLEWISREVVDIGGTRWLRMEFTTSMEDLSMRQVYYLAPFQGGGLWLAQVAPASAHAQWEAVLAASAATVQLNDCR